MVQDFNQNLQPVNAPVSAEGAVSGYQFDAETERNSVGNTKLVNFTFNKGTGGTLTLGGTVISGSVGVNGLLIVKNQGGSTIVQIDQNGIAVTDGSVSIKNSSGTTLMDSTGILSTNNFLFGTAGNTNSQIITSSGYSDVSGLSITTGSFSRNVNILIAYTAKFDLALAGTAYQTGYLTVNIDGTDQDPSIFNVYWTDNMLQPGYFYSRTVTVAPSGIVNLGTGTHTIKLRAKSSDGTTGVEIFSAHMYYLQLAS